MIRLSLRVLALMGVLLAIEAQANEKVLKWGADAEGGAPYAFRDPRDPSRIIGFEVDLMNEVAAMLGMKA